LRSKTAVRIFKVELLDSATEDVVEDLTDYVLDGSINISDNSGSRRSASITFNNTGGEFIPDSDGTIWMNNKFRISTGTMVDNDEYLIQRGIFICSEPEINSDLDASNSITVQFLDKWNLIDKNLENTYIIPVGTSIKDAIDGILSEVGEVKTAIVEPTTEVTPYTITASYDTTYGNILIELANMISWVCYFDNNGYFRCESPTDIETAGSVWEFSTSEITYLDSRHLYEFSKVYNAITIIGDSYAGATVRYTAEDNGVDSSTSIAKIGRRPLTIEDSLISSTPLAQARAEFELQKSISLVETLDMSAMPVDVIDSSNIITVTDSGSGLSSTRFLVKNVNFPLNIDANMTMQCWKGRSLT